MLYYTAANCQGTPTEPLNEGIDTIYFNRCTNVKRGESVFCSPSSSSSPSDPSNPDSNNNGGNNGGNNNNGGDSSNTGGNSNNGGSNNTGGNVVDNSVSGLQPNFIQPADPTGATAISAALSAVLAVAAT